MKSQLTENVRYLEDVATSILDAITQQTETEFDGVKKVEPVLVPTYDKYPSIWVRDVAMNAECGMIAPSLLKRHILLFAKYAQNGEEEIKLENYLRVPPYAVADHLNYNGRPVYFPGTYSDGTNQGNGTFGYYPSLDDNYYLVHVVYLYISQTGDTDILRENCSGMTLLERLEKAWESYHVDAKTDLHYSRLPYYTVDWGFADTVMKSGLLMFPSMLRYLAAKELSELFTRLGDGGKADYYGERAEKVRNSIIDTFWDGSGWLYSATRLCHQYDVWGTIYAIYIGLLPAELEAKAAEAVSKAYLEDQIAVHGYVRMIRTVDDDEFGQSWEAPNVIHTKPDNYQNGGYWGSASGWLFYALAKADIKLAEKCIEEFVMHTEKYRAEGAPFEFINRACTYWEGKLAGTCATLPYAGAKRIIDELC